MTDANNNNLPGRILIVDDDPSIAQSMQDPLARYGIRLDRATDLDTALYLFNQNRFDVVLVELEFAPLPGIALVQKWRKHDVLDKRATGIIITSGNKRDSLPTMLFKEIGEIEYLPKPFNAIQLLPVLSRALAARKRAMAFYEMKTKHLDFYEKTGDFDKAAAQVQKNLKLLGHQGLATLTELYEKGGKYEEAMPIIDKMLDADPENIGLLNARGRLLIRLGKYTEARQYLEKADKLAPQNIERINDMATMYLHLKQPDASVAKFRELLALNPENPELKFEMFAKLYQHGFDDQAISFGKETAQPMEIVRHYNNKGVLLAKAGNMAEAVTEYKRALRFYPKFKQNYRIYFNIALAYTNEKNREAYVQAQEYLEKCLELQPEFDKAKNTLDVVRKALGQKKAV